MAVPRGTFRLYDSVDPALTAGKYVLTTNLEITGKTADGAPATPPVDALQTHINVTAPRFRLPPDQALQVFPPANSEGAYEARLPQIVLKRRTLPWDREVAPVGTTINGQRVQDHTPWLALVVIAEGEGQIVHDALPRSCVTPGVKIEGDVDVARGSYLSVPQSTVDKVFPTIDDLILLTHVREVNLDDTEMAMGDDDGFLSVVIANRMPQFDRVNCRPKAYTACLINLEGQLDVLPRPAPPRMFFDISDLIFTKVAQDYARAVATGAPVTLASTNEVRLLDTSNGTAIADAVRRGEVVLHDGRLVDRAGLRADGTLSTVGSISVNDFLDGSFSSVVAEAAAADQRVSRVAGTFAAFDFPLHLLFGEKFYRFPVLTSWRFTCSGAGGFEQLMKNLDVGLLGTTGEGGYRRPLADCVPEVTGDDPGAAPVTRLPLEIAETGHVGVDHVTRTGIGKRAWYRGPLSPHQLLRNPLAEEAPFPVLAHVSDHLRMMTPEGREDLSLAVAFETGRLLALSHPSFVASMLRWRAESFGAARARSFQHAVIIDKLNLLDRFVTPDDILRMVAALERGLIPREIEGVLFREMDRMKERVVSQPLPLVTSGISVPALAGDFAAILAGGLGIDRGLADMLVRSPGDMRTIAALHGAEPGLVATSPVEIGPTLDRNLEADARPGPCPHRRAGRGAAGARPRLARPSQGFPEDRRLPRRPLREDLTVAISQISGLDAVTAALNDSLFSKPAAGATIAPEDILNFLARLRMLQGVPFNTLVPDAELLPNESIRFFFLDRAWTDALVQGALSVGTANTIERAQLEKLYPQIEAEVDAHERRVRAPGGEPVLGGTAGVITGFLLRSAAVAGWPGLHVRAYRDEPAANDEEIVPESHASRIKLLRLERLAPAVLLALFDGIPSVLHLEEPRQGIQFGVRLNQGQGSQWTAAVPARNVKTGRYIRADGTPVPDDGSLVAPSSRAAQIPVRFRPGAPGVMDLANTARAFLAAPGTDMNTNSPGVVDGAEFAFQMIRFPYRQVFAQSESSAAIQNDAFRPTIANLSETYTQALKIKIAEG
jgi:hypothetical protein